MRLVNEIKPTLDPLDANFYPIEPPVHARQPFFDCSQSNLDVKHLVNDAIKLRVEAAQILKDDVVWFLHLRCLLLRRDHVGGIQNTGIVDTGFA
jgi:hypothetical protein